MEPPERHIDGGDRYGAAGRSVENAADLRTVGILAELQDWEPDLPHLALTLVASNVPAPSAEQQRRHYIGARKLLYQSDRFELDLWLEDPQGTSEAVVLGRVSSITPEEAEPEPVVEAGVFLIEEGKLASSTLTNRFGEFHLEAAPEGQLDLKILIRDRGRIELSLPREDL